MSTRFVVAAVAAVVVTYASGGNVAAGFATFSAVYGVTGFLDPNTKVQGPRLNDLKFPAASYGSPIPYVEGHPRVPGIITWSIDPKREVATTATSDGKGGPGVDQTTYTYEVDMRIILCENTGFRPRRCWSNGALIWSAADDADTETLQASADTVSWRELRIYTGDDAQMPDPTEEAYVGTGLSPAYRGRSSIVIVGLNCGQSGQLPVLTWEISNGAAMEVISGPPGLLCNFEAAGSVPGSASSAIGPDVTGDAHTSLSGGAGVISAVGESFGVGGSIVGTLGSYWRIESKAKRSQNGGVIFSFSGPLGRGVSIRATPAGDVTSNNSFQADVVTINGGASGIPDSGVTVENGLNVDHYYAAQWNGSELWFYLDGQYVGTFGSALDDWDGVSFTTYSAGGGSFAGEIGFVAFNPNVALEDLYGSIYAPVDPVLPWGDDLSITTVELAEPTHAEALTRQWERAGLDAGLIDVSAPALSTLRVRAMAVSQLSPPRVVMDNLAAVGLYEYIEDGGPVRVVYAKPPNGRSSMTIINVSLTEKRALLATDTRALERTQGVVRDVGKFFPLVEMNALLAGRGSSVLLSQIALRSATLGVNFDGLLVAMPSLLAEFVRDGHATGQQRVMVLGWSPAERAMRLHHFYKHDDEGGGFGKAQDIEHLLGPVNTSEVHRRSARS